MRPSLTSVAPYDDNAQTLMEKVENIDQQISLRKKSTRKTSKYLNNQNEGEIDNQNALKHLNTQKEKLMQSRKVVANGGK
jgi:hypothetical protein